MCQGFLQHVFSLQPCVWGWTLTVTWNVALGESAWLREQMWWGKWSVMASGTFRNNSGCSSNLGHPLRGTADGRLCSLSAKGGLREAAVLLLHESPSDFHQWFTKAFSKWMGMDTGVDQNRLLILSTSVVALLQAQVREKVSVCQKIDSFSGIGNSNPVWGKKWRKVKPKRNSRLQCYLPTYSHREHILFWGYQQIR